MKIFIMGGGPVGLSLAIYLLSIYVNISIILCEKRTSYTRKQVLLIKPDTLSFFPPEIYHKIITKGCAVNPPATSRGRCYQNTSSGMFSITTNVLKKIFREYVEKFPNFNSINKDTVNMQELMQFDYIFGCDGGNSFIGNNIMNIKPQSSTIYYGLAVVAKPIIKKFYNKSSLQLFQPEHRYRGFITRKGDYYLGVSISKQTYDSIKNQIPTNKMIALPSNLDSKNKAIITEGFNYYNWKIKSYTVTPFEIKNYRRIPVAKVIQNKKFFLVGDAACGAHFFGGEGANTGFREAYFLAKNLNNTNIIPGYNKFVNNEYNKNHAKMKNLVIPFDQIDQMYSHYSLYDLKKLAKAKNIRISNLDTHEIMMVLGYNLIN